MEADSVYTDKNVSNLPDAELVKYVNAGRYEYLQILINRYMPFILKVAKKYSVSGLEPEDLIQEGILAVFSAVKAYDSEKSKFSTFVALCVNRAIMGQFKATCTVSRIPDVLITPIDDVEITDLNNPETIVIDKESYERFKDKICENLSKLEFKVLKDFIDGYSYADIAQRLSISVKSVDNSLKRIRSKLK